MRQVIGRDVPDIIKVHYHRLPFFGKPFFELARAVMRGPSPWTGLYGVYNLSISRPMRALSM